MTGESLDVANGRTGKLKLPGKVPRRGYVNGRPSTRAELERSADLDPLSPGKANVDEDIPLGQYVPTYIFTSCKRMRIGKHKKKKRRTKKEAMSKQQESVNLISRVESRTRNGTKGEKE
ncbi:hypothetical protein WN51_08654 [Melipona quadrifasciata]|uniref:Uncharacterized protein n=1 Tax=Melipona quadrifasciata TaxID=166423 RepID=A0A0M9A7M2_9HYME|nr:hypothetical protein WN51_08654 [Melipona quadrifasciata]